jgi:peptidyl-prolyl cis-trans isomerase A (cyclophilin A)
MNRLTILFSACIFAIFTPAIFAGQVQSAPASAAQKTPTPTHPRTTPMTTDPTLLHPAALNAKAPDVFNVKFTTTKGDFVVQVTRAWAPLGADRFYNLVKHGFFTDAAFFRVVPGFIIQFGLSANPAVNKVWQSANIKDDPSKQSNKPGYLTFATAGPNTRTTQLFINFGNNTFLDSQGFTPFGQVTSGMEVVQKLYSGYGERPDQHSITALGKPYLDKNFPDIDSISSATIVTP